MIPSCLDLERVGRNPVPFKRVRRDTSLATEGSIPLVDGGGFLGFLLHLSSQFC